MRRLRPVGNVRQILGKKLSRTAMATAWAVSRVTPTDVTNLSLGVTGRVAFEQAVDE